MQLQNLIESLLSNEPDLENKIPLSIQALENNILVKAKFYEGDLLMTVLAVKESFWKTNDTLWKEVLGVLEKQSDRIKNEAVSFEMKVDWYEKIKRFKGMHL
jgi:hypothetical protein